MANAMAMKSAMSVGVHHQPCQALGRVPTKEARCSRASSGGGGLAGTSNAGLAALNAEQFRVSQSQRRAGWRPLTVTNAATKIKSPAEADWKTKREVLLKAKARFMVRSVVPKEALLLQKDQGYTIIDVRPEIDHKEAHPAGAINVQVYRLIKEWTLWDISRRVAFAFFGIFQGTEENPEFLNEVNAVLDKNDKIIVACIAGGTLKPTPNMADGSQSRSLIAAYLLTLDGFTNVVHMEGGLKQWFKADLPTEEVVEA